MLKKRMIGVITVRQGLAVQSMGYQRYLPVGRPEIVAENLDRWGVDEILLVCIDRDGLGPDIALIHRVSAQGLSTPFIYSGGIRHAEHARQVVAAGADRIAVDAVLDDQPQALIDMAAQLGAQALIAVMPFTLTSGQLQRYQYRQRRSVALSMDLLTLFEQGTVSEIMWVDWQHEGYPEQFQLDVLNAIQTMPSVAQCPAILFGGLYPSGLKISASVPASSEASLMRRAMAAPGVAAIAIGNGFLYREHAVDQHRQALASAAIRPVRFPPITIHATRSEQ